MARTRFWRRSKNYRPKRLLQQLEERIVLDAAVNPTQDNPNDQPSGQADAAGGQAGAGTSAAPASDGAGGNAGLVAQLPTSFEQVFGQDLNVVLVANSLADVDAISHAATENAHVVKYDAANDNLATITAMLQEVVASSGHKIDNLAIVGHSSEGVLSIGTDYIQFFTLSNHKATFEALGQTLTQDAQIQFYGCYVAGDTLGEALVDRIAIYTQADTFASTDATGGATHDWTLEHSSNATVTMDTLLDSAALASVTTELANPYMVKEINTSSQSEATGFFEVNGKVYYQATDGVHVRALWVYDPVADTNTLLMEAPYVGYNVAALTSIGDNLFFKSTDAAHGTELWVTDGTVLGTHIVKDISVGTGSGLAFTPTFAVLNGELIFSASNNASSNYELWKTDGTELGTTLVKEIHSTASSNPANFKVMGNEVFFTATNGVNGIELWKTDGTDTGTVMISDIDPNQAAYSGPGNLTVMNNLLYFTATTAANGNELYVTNGIPDGTVGADTHRVTDLAAGTASSSPGNLTPLGEKLIFTATTTATGVEVFAYDSVGGTSYLLKDIKPGGTSSSPSLFTVLGNKVIFKASDYVNTSSLYGSELWSTDGTVAGTKIVKDICAGFQDSYATNLTVFDDGVQTARLFFQASNGAITGKNGQELWSITPSGVADDPLTANVDESWTTAMVADINPLVAGSTPANLTAMGGNLYFTATDGVNGSQIWKATLNGNPDDPTGTPLVDESVTIGAVTNGIGLTGPGALKAVGTELVFIGNDGISGIEPWVTDGTSLGTHMIQDINHIAGGNVQWLKNVNGTLYFAAQDATHGLELWTSDGTAGGTYMIMDLYPGTTSGVYNQYMGYPTVVNDTLYFLGMSSGTTDSALYKLNSGGTPVLVKNINAGVADDLTYFTGSGNTVYFNKGWSTSAALWSSDGTDAGTGAVTSGTGSAVTATANMTDVNGTLFFTGTSSSTGNELFKIDSLTHTEVLVKDLASGTGSSTPANLIKVGGTLYFTANDGTGLSLWKSDGTDAGTTKISSTLTAFANLTDVNGTLFFTGTRADTGAELAYVDGAGAIQVVDIVTGTTGSAPTNLFNSYGKLFFSATDSTNGKEVWTYTAGGGATLLKDINPGTGGSFFSTNSFTSFDGFTYFKATDGTNGDELWQTDGTSAGTMMVGDIYTGASGSNPGELTAVNNSLFFSAMGLGTGTELWKFDGSGTNTIPTATLMDQTNTIDEDAPAFSLQDIVITDNDAGDIITATLDLDNAAAGVLSATDGATYNSATGLWSVSGTVTQVNAALANVTFTPTTDWNGTVNLTSHVQDALGTGPANGLITIDVTAVNDAPAVSLDGTVHQTDASGAVIFNLANGNLISVSDVDAGTGLVRVTLTATHGTMTLNGVAGLTFDPGQDGTADAIMSFTGTLTNVNNALNKMSFNRDAGYTGLADVTVTVNDQGNTGTGVTPPATAVANLSVEPYDVWFAGFGTEAGWDVFNSSTGAFAYYTHDYVLYWQHMDVGGTWNFWNGTAWVSTNALGNAPYEGGYGPPNQWFHETTGTYSGYDVFIVASGGSTYYSLDHTAAGATYWEHTNTGAWLYFDGSTAHVTAGFNVEPVDAWFHGYGPDAGWDVFNSSTGAFAYYTHDYVLYWQHMDVGGTWNFWNGNAWVSTNALGNAPYDGGFGPPMQWFHETTGTYSGYDVFISAPGGTTYYSTNYAVPGATYWQQTSAGAWSYWDGAALFSTTGFNVEPVDAWFHGYGADVGWHVFNHSSTGDEYFSQDLTVFWWHVAVGNTWNYWNGSAWLPTAGLGVVA
jgi:trimeric autotransporter adhesin